MTDAMIPTLSDTALEALSEAEQATRAVFGDAYNYYSDACLPEKVAGFDAAVRALAGSDPTEPVGYLEIGSCQGLSMAIVTGLIRRRIPAGVRAMSIDPYFPDGYIEGLHRHIDKTTRDGALAVYRALDLDVELREETSGPGMAALIEDYRRFDLIYVDGGHKGTIPSHDVVQAIRLLAPGGVLLMDDVNGNHIDVLLVKEVIDRAPLERLYDHPRLVAYRAPDDAEALRTIGQDLAAALLLAWHDRVLIPQAPPPSEWIRRMERAIDHCAAAGHQRIALYGGGTHTKMVAEVLADPSVEIACIIDDNAVPGRRMWGLPVVTPAEAAAMELGAIILSANSIEEQLWDRTEAFRARGVEVLRLYSGT